MDIGKRGVKWSSGSGNIFTLAEVEKKIKSALFNKNITTRRASDDTWKRIDRVGNLKILVVGSGESQGKRKTRDFNGGGEEMAKQGRIKGGRSYKPCGVLLKDDKIGSGVVEAINQPCQLQ